MTQKTREQLDAEARAAAAERAAFNAPLLARIGERVNDPAFAAAVAEIVATGEQLLGPNLANELARSATALGRSVEMFRKVAAASTAVARSDDGAA